MGRQGGCITIERKDGKRATIPLTVWEAGLNLDTDWHVYVPPVVVAPVAPLEVVELKKPLPIPVELVEKKLGKKKGK